MHKQTLLSRGKVGWKRHAFALLWDTSSLVIGVLYMYFFTLMSYLL